MSTCCFNLPFGLLSVRVLLMKHCCLLTFGISTMIWGMKWAAVRMPGCLLIVAYLVVSVMSVTRPDMLLSCEAAVGKLICYISPTLMEPLWWACFREVCSVDNSRIDPDPFHIATHVASRDVGNVGVNTNTSKVPQLLIPRLKKNPIFFSVHISRSFYIAYAESCLHNCIHSSC